MKHTFYLLTVLMIGSSLCVQEQYQKVTVHGNLLRFPRIAGPLIYALNNSELVEMASLSFENDQLSVAAHSMHPECLNWVFDQAFGVQAHQCIKEDCSTENITPHAVPFQDAALSTAVINPHGLYKLLFIQKLNDVNAVKGVAIKKEASGMYSFSPKMRPNAQLNMRQLVSRMFGNYFGDKVPASCTELEIEICSDEEFLEMQRVGGHSDLESICSSDEN